MELSREILKRFAQIANGNSNKKQTTPSYMNATAVVSDGVKYVQIDGSDQLTPVSETMGIQNGDRVLVTIENHQATVIGNYSYPADARTANEALSVGGQALTAAGQAIQRIDVLQASSITTENLQAGLASIGYLTATELRALNATVDTLDAKAITTDTLETESAKIGFVKAAQIEGTYATIEQLNAATARIGTLETDTLKSKDLESEVGKFGYLKADEAKLTYATIEQLNAKTVTADEILGVVIKAGYLTADNADFKYATITNLNAATARIGTLETDTLKTKDLESEVGKFGYLKASNLESEVGEFGYLKADDAEVTYATIKQLDTESARIDVVTGDLASYKTVVAGQFTANDAVISELKAKDAELNTAIIGKASISELDAVKTRTGTLEANVADIDDLVNGNLTSDNIHSLVIAGDKFSIENGFIKNAMIENMSFDKITGFDINTTNFTVHSNDGKSTWTDNTIQISDSNRIRVQIGKDASGDYNIYIWDVNGNLMFDPLYGVQASGIKQAIIRNDMVSETAAIAGSKLDIESVVTEINGATTKLKSTTIYLDSEKQTLDVAFNTMETTITNNLNAAKEYANGVGTNTLSSAQQYAVEKANAALASANKHTDDELADIEEITTSHATQIGVIQGQITSLISEDSNIKGDYNVLLSRYNSTVSDVDSIKSTIGEHTTLINSQNGEIEAVRTQVNTIESDLSGTKQTVSSMQTTVNSTESRVTTVETNLNGLTARVSETETDMSSLESRVSTAETTLTKDGLTTIIGTYYSTPENVDDAIENLEIGGRNLLPNSNFTNGTDGWVGYNDASLRVSNDTYYDKALIINHSNIIGSNPSKGMVYKTANDFVHESDTTYTLSFMAKTTGASSGAEPILFSAAVKLSSNDIAKSKTHNIASSQWQKFTYTYATGTITSDVVIAFWIANGPGPVYITNIKLEKGNKATDWTPAPEDVQGQIDSNVSKISSHETRITANEEAINLRVTSQEFTEYQNGVAANFSSIDTSLSVLNGAIESKVEQVDINNAIAGLEIGGRNLLRNSNFKNGSQYWLGVNAPLNVIADSVYGNALSFYTTIKGSVSDRIYYDASSQGFSHVAGETYTLSFFAKASVNTKLQSSVAGNATSIETYELTTTWQRFTHTYTAPQHGSLSFWPVDANVTIYLTNVKLEKGNKATDWTPAPEDIDANIASISTRVSELSIDLDGITQRVSATETTTTGLESRVSTAESKLTKDGLVTTIGSYYTTLGQLNNAIDSIEIGGRNLIRGTKDMSGFYTNSANLITDEDGFTFASFSPSSLNYWKLESTVHPISFSVVRNKEVVLSFYARSDDWESLNASASNGILLTFVLCDAESTTKLRSRDVKLYTCNLSNEWQKIFITATLSDDYFTSGSGTIDDTTRIYIRFNNYSECSMQVKQFKLELGNKATDWTPAPEDTQNQLDAMNSRLTTTETSLSVLDGKIESKVTQTEIDNAIAGIDIGGRNLLTKTKTLDTTGVAEKLDETYLGFTVGHYDATSLGTSSYKDVLSGWIPTKEPEAGGQYVLSFYAKGSGQIRTHFYGGSYKTILSENSSNNTNTASDGFSIFNLTSEWKKYWVRYTLESSNTLSTTGNKTVLFRVYGGNEVYVCGVKLEKGNKPTDWSPAPEDAGTIDDIIIGGRNLILQSKDFTTGSKYWSIASPWTTSVDDEGYTVASINVIGNSSTAWYRLIPQNNIPTSECTNGVIVSFDFMCDDLAALDNKCICSLQNYTSDGARVAWYEPTFDTTHARYIPGVYSFSEELENGKWVRVTVKFTYADLTKTHTESIPDYSRLSFNLVQNGSIHIKRCKAEYGNKATDWTPAPEDTETQITEVRTIATQTSEKFNWLVASGTSATDFTLTDRTATLIAETISLNGDVKVNGDMIVDQSITAAKIDVTDLFAQDITATGTITGVNLVGATGAFSGDVTATTLTATGSGTIGCWNFTANRIYDSASSAGINKNGSGQAFWAGGTDLTGGSAPFRVGHDGAVTTTNITAIGGKIGCFNIDSNSMYTSYDTLTNTNNYSNIYLGSDGIGFGKSYLNSNGAIAINAWDGTGSAIEGNSMYFYSGSVATVEIHGASNGYINAGAFNAGRINMNSLGVYFNTTNGEGTVWNQAQLRLSGGTGSQGISLVGYLDGTQAFWHTLADDNGNTSFGKNLSVSGNTYLKGTTYVSSHMVVSNNVNIKTYNASSKLVSMIAWLNDNRLYVGDYNNRATKIRLAQNCSNIGVLSASTGTTWVTITTGVSDIREKNSIEDLQKSKEIIMGLKSKRFKYNDPEDDRWHLGFVAQDVRKTLDATIGDCAILEYNNSDPDEIRPVDMNDESTFLYSMRYNELIPPHIALTQEHEYRLNEFDTHFATTDARVDSLQCQLEQAHDKISQLEKQLEALQIAG